MRIIAISDIHAHPQTFKMLLEEQVILNKSDKLFLLGDYVHRGPSHEAVFDYILDLQKQGYQIQGLFGNHEMIWIDELEGKKKKIPKRYRPFIHSLKFHIEYENFIFVHGGLNFKTSKPLEDKLNMIWIRNWYNDINYKWLDGRIIVHGHTPMTETEIRWRVKKRKQAIGIDNGCFVNFKKGMGQLCAFDLTNWELYFQENIDK